MYIENNCYKKRKIVIDEELSCYSIKNINNRNKKYLYSVTYNNLFDTSFVKPLLSLPLNTKYVYDRFLENMSVTYDDFISMYNRVVNNNIIYKLSSVLNSAVLYYKKMDDMRHFIINSRVIYVIMTASRVYVGQTKFFDQRVKQHLYCVRKYNNNKNDIICFPSMNTSKNISTYLYKYISKHPFVILPLFRIHEHETLYVESMLIKQFGHVSLNTKNDYVDNLHKKNIITSQKVNNRCSKRSVGNTLGRSVLKQVWKKKKKKSQGCDKIRLPMFYKEGICFVSFLSVLSNHINECIYITFYPNGKMVDDINICIYSYYNSIVIYNNERITLSVLCNLLKKTKTKMIFAIKPIRNNSLTEMLFLLIAENCETNRIDFLLNILNETTLKDITVFFWIRLFKIANKFNNRRTTLKIRKFIKDYIFFFYNINNKEITLNISFNVSVPYSPFINKNIFTLCHKNIILAFTDKPFILNNTYTTLKKEKPLSVLILNHHNFLKDFKEDMVVTCACNTKTLTHKIIMPYEMPLMDDIALRNVKVPKRSITNKSLKDVLLSFINVIGKFTLILNRENVVLSDFDFIFNDYNNSIDIFIKSKNVLMSFNINSLNVFLLVLSFVDIGHMIILDLFLTNCDLFVTNSSNSSIMLLKLLYDVVPVDVLMKNRYLIRLINLNFTDIKYNHKHNHYFTLNNTLCVYSFILKHKLMISGCKTCHIDSIITMFNNIIIKNVKNNYDPEREIVRIKNKYKNMIWIPIDKNSRKLAAICPVRLKEELIECFVQDKKHFSVISKETDDEKEFLYTKIICQKMKKTWLKKTWCNKPNFLPNLSISIKLDGVRFRPIGMYHKVPFLKLLSYISRGLVCITEFSGLKTFTIHRCNDVKQFISNFNDICLENDYDINCNIMDIKNFFTEVQVRFLLPRLRYVLSNYSRKNKTSFVSVPIYKHNKLKPVVGKSNSTKYLHLSLEMLYDVVVFACENAYFRLGSYIFKQSDGLPQGSPISPPLSCIYVMKDEHRHSTSLRYITLHVERFLLFIMRYADDLIRFIAAKKIDNDLIKKIDNYITNDLYEYDVDGKNLLLVPSGENKYLDSNIVIYDNNKRIKMTYHNKNKNIMSCNYQEVGRFLHKNDCMHIKTKINTFTNILVRISDNTTYEDDYIEPTIQLLYEMHMLNYDKNDMIAAIIAANRARKHIIWNACIAIVRGL